MEKRLDFRDPEWVSKQLGIDKNAVYRYLDEGRLPGMRLGRKWLISESTLVEQLKREEREQTEHRRLAALQRGPISPDKFAFPFSERARQAISVALEESAARGHSYIGQEHLLLALSRDPHCAGARILNGLGFDPREAVESVLAPGDFPIAAERGLTPRAIRVLEIARDEATLRSQEAVGTEHLLLGMTRMDFEVLRDGGIDADQVEKAIAKLTEEGRD